MRRTEWVRPHFPPGTMRTNEMAINWALVVGLGLMMLGLLAQATQSAPQKPKGKAKPVKSSAPQIVRYRVNPPKSTFVVHSSTSGLLVHDRESVVTKYNGEVKLRVTNQKSGNVPRVVPVSLTFIAGADSLRSRDDLSDADRNRIDVNVRDKILEAKRYPRIKFQSTSLTASQNGTKGRVQITGNLTLHGVTRKVTFPATVTGNQNALRARGGFTIKQTDYKIALFSYLGAITVNNPVRFEFDIACDRIK